MFRTGFKHKRERLDNKSGLYATVQVPQCGESAAGGEWAWLKAAHPGCCVIVCLHWGKEHTLEPTPTQRHQAHQLVDAGADALVCHHTHTLQSVEHYCGTPIFYSLGNYIFDLPSEINRRGTVVILRITADSLHAEQHPFTIVGCTPCLH